MSRRLPRWIRGGPSTPDSLTIRSLGQIFLVAAIAATLLAYVWSTFLASRCQSSCDPLTGRLAPDLRCECVSSELQEVTR